MMLKRGLSLATSVTMAAALSATHPASTTPATSTSPAAQSARLMWTSGAKAMRTWAQEAARLDTAHSLDVTGIMWLEHVNLVVGSKPLAERFYQDIVGMTRDPDAKFHVNLGQQQFHLAENGEPAQRVVGSLGVVVPNLNTLRQRVVAAVATDEFKETQLAVVDDDLEGGCLTLICPWGNTLHFYSLSDDDQRAPVAPASSSTHKMVNAHAPGGSYATDRMAVRGNPGIRYIEVTCRSGTSAAIARFYREMLGCSVSTPAPALAAVCVGPGVHLMFVEDPKYSEADAKDMAGVHICVYAADFEALYRRLESRRLVWTNPRFTHLDSCHTWEEAAASRTLRFKDIIDLATGEVLLELEHETRPLRHGQYLKAPHYEKR